MNPSDDDPMNAERRRMAAAFDGVLTEPVPARLQALLATPARDPAVVDLAAVRARRRGMPGWAAWGGMAATLLLGTLMGRQLGSPGNAADSAQLVATGAVAQALERQLAGDPAGTVTVQLSFRDRGGRYCRSFATAGTAGWACRQLDGAWALQQVMPTTPGGASDFRQASTTLPPELLNAIDAAAAGSTLNAAQERAARDAGWRP